MRTQLFAISKTEDRYFSAMLDSHKQGVSFVYSYKDKKDRITEVRIVS